jgi:hypothetical protein
MKRLAASLVVALLPLLPAAAWAGSSTDAALGLGAFAVFNQIIAGTGLFGGLAPAAPRPVVYAQPAPVVVAPPPPPVYVAAPAPVYVAPRPVYIAPRPVYVTPRPVVVVPQPVYVAPRPVVVYRSAGPAHLVRGHGPRGHRGW